MIQYHGPYNFRRPYILGQDAAITPAPAAPVAPPTPEPFGSGAPGGPTLPPSGPSAPTPAPAPAPAAAPAPSKPWTVTIAGKEISGWTLVLSGLIITGGIALVAFTKADVDKYYARKT